MDVNLPPVARLAAGAGGGLLLVSLFLPWAEAGGASRSGWELWTMADVLFLVVGTFGIVTALSGGRFGLFRPDVSFAGATDVLAVVSTVLLVWLLAFDFPEGASRQAGAFLALVGAFAQACAVGDYRVLRGAPVFPRPPSG